MINVKIDYKTRQKMALQLRESIVKYINDGAVSWLRRNDPDMQMWEMTVNDSEDLIVIASLLDGRTDESYDKPQLRAQNEPLWSCSAGKDIEQAFRAACDLDTAVRDEIPKDVWNWMSFVSQEEKNEHWAKLDDGAKYNR